MAAMAVEAEQDAYSMLKGQQTRKKSTGVIRPRWFSVVKAGAVVNPRPAHRDFRASDARAPTASGGSFAGRQGAETIKLRPVNGRECHNEREYQHRHISLANNIGDSTRDFNEISNL